MAESNYEYVLSMVDKVSAKLDLIERALGKTDAQVKRTQSGVFSLSGAFNKLGAVTFNLNNIGNSLNSLTAPVRALGSGIFNATASAEQFNVALTTMLKSKQKADQLSAGIASFAASTPFELTQVQDASRKLLAFGVDAQSVMPALKALGDVSAGVGAPIQEIAELYGKAKVQGRLFAEDINQLTGRGIPIIQELAKQFKTTDANVKAMVENGKVNFGNLEVAFQSLSGKGGQFAGLMEAQSKTLGGQFSNLKDAVTQLQVKIGNGLNPVFAEGIRVMNSGLGVISKVYDNFYILAAATLPLRNAFGGLFTAIGGLLDKLGLLKSSGDPVINTMANIGLVFQVLALPVEAVLNLLTFVISHLDTVAQYAIALGVSIVSLATVFAILNPQVSLFIARMALMAAYTWAVTAATNAMAVMQGILNAVMNMNPIFLIITGLALFAAGLVYAYKQSETFRGIVDAAFSAILTPVSYAYKAIMRVVEAMKEVLRYMGLLSKEGDKQLEKAVSIANNQKYADQNAEAEKVGGMQGIANRGGLEYKGDLNNALANASNLPAAGAGGAGAAGGSSTALSGIKGGGAKQTNITIQQVKFTDAININSQTVREGVAELEGIIDEALLRTLNGAQQIAE